jgi:hypothetical protein
LMGQYHTDANDRGGIVGDAAVVEGQADRTDEGGAAMVGSIPCGIHEDGHEGMDPPRVGRRRSP